MSTMLHGLQWLYRESSTSPGTKTRAGGNGYDVARQFRCQALSHTQSLMCEAAVAFWQIKSSDKGELVVGAQVCQ